MSGKILGVSPFCGRFSCRKLQTPVLGSPLTSQGKPPQTYQLPKETRRVQGICWAGLVAASAGPELQRNSPRASRPRCSHRSCLCQRSHCSPRSPDADWVVDAVATQQQTQITQYIYIYTYTHIYIYTLAPKQADVFSVSKKKTWFSFQILGPQCLGAAVILQDTTIAVQGTSVVVQGGDAYRNPKRKPQNWGGGGGG